MAVKKAKASEQEPIVCGIVMPISECDGCLPEHWADVLTIIREAVKAVGFDARLVSTGRETEIIHKRIVENLYKDPIVVCDVSGKNPNVMFELGMRLAFDKPTVVIKDDVTDYSFDTSPIEHLEYPRDLRYHQIVKFKEDLRSKVEATHNRALKDESYSPFVGQFGPFKVANIPTKELTSENAVMFESLKRIEESLERLKIESGRKSRRVSGPSLKDANRMLRVAQLEYENHDFESAWNSTLKSVVLLDQATVMLKSNDDGVMQDAINLRYEVNEMVKKIKQNRSD